MKTLNYLWFFTILFFLASCQKDEMTVNLKQSGKLVIELKDSTGKVYPGVKVSLRLSLYSEGTELDSKKTDSKGKVNFGELEAGTYYVVADTIKAGNKYFVVGKPVQVISGTTKNFSLDPYEFTGTINIRIDFQNSSSAKITPTNVKIALIKRNDYVPNANRQKIIAKAVDIKTLNANSSATFTNVPANIYYKVYLYLNDNDTTGYWVVDYVGVNKDQTYSTSYMVYASALIIVKKNFDLTINYYSYDYSNYMPVKNLNVILVKYSDYQSQNLYSASYSTILSYKIANGITNTSGKVTFANIPVGDYYAYGYYSESLETWIQYISVYENSTNSESVTISGNSLGLN